MASPNVNKLIQQAAIKLGRIIWEILSKDNSDESQRRNAKEVNEYGTP